VTTADETVTAEDATETVTVEGEAGRAGDVDETETIHEADGAETETAAALGAKALTGETGLVEAAGPVGMTGARGEGSGNSQRPTFNHWRTCREPKLAAVRIERSTSNGSGAEAACYRHAACVWGRDEARTWWRFCA